MVPNPPANSRSRASYQAPRSARCHQHRHHPSPPRSPTPPPSPTFPRGPPMRPTRVVFGTKVRSPAVMLASVAIESRGLVTDAEFRANGWDVYRVRHRNDGDRVYAEINARNPERAIWRAEQFKDTDGNFEDMFDMDAMFDVDDEDGTDAEDDPVEVSAHPVVSNEEVAIQPPVVPNEEVAAQPDEPPTKVLPVQRTDGETAERRWSRMGLGREAVAIIREYREGDVAQHLERLRGMFR